MRTQKRLILTIVTTLGVLLAFAAPIAAQASVTEITGTEDCTTTNEGIWTFHDGNVHIRGMVLLCRETSSDPRATGKNTVVMNANWDANGFGPMWGTAHIETDEGGVWEGTWEGLVTTSVSKYHARATGQGVYEGMKQWVDSVNGEFQGRILDPHGG